MAIYPNPHGSNHAITMVDESTFIDNGFEMRYDLDDLYTIVVIEARKNGL